MRKESKQHKLIIAVIIVFSITITSLLIFSDELSHLLFNQISSNGENPLGLYISKIVLPLFVGISVVLGLIYNHIQTMNTVNSTALQSNSIASNRLNNAIEHLGSNNQSVILGGHTWMVLI